MELDGVGFMSRTWPCSSCLCRNILEGKKILSGQQGVYITETGLSTHMNYSQHLADAGHKLGYLTFPTVMKASLDEVAKGFTNGNRLVAELSYGAKCRAPISAD